MARPKQQILAVGDPAPDFTLLNDIGQDVSLHDYAGKWLVLYFYPHDDAPACTVEACSLRDARDDIMALGADIVGVSMDAPAIHERFKARHSLNFTLLSDPKAIMIEQYNSLNHHFWLVFKRIIRKTYIIGPDGHIARIYAYTTPIGSGARIAAELRELQRAAHAL
jgi:peroxiredoxin Q/BCP